MTQKDVLGLQDDQDVLSSPLLEHLHGSVFRAVLPSVAWLEQVLPGHT